MELSASPAALVGWTARTRSALSAFAGAAAFSGFAFWLYYSFLRQVAGPLNADEIYFAHTFWLLNEGKRQYVDFFSQHLPTYFHLLKPLVAAYSASSTDLSYVWGIRGLSALIILGYLGLAWRLHRAATPHTGRTGLMGMGALLLVFVVLARMVEIRSDTVGLLFVNAAWGVVLCERTHRRMLAAAFLAGLAVLFSARAAGMVAVLGLCLVFLASSSRDWTGLRALLLVAGCFVAAGAALYLVAPDWVAQVVRACFVNPGKLVTGSSLSRRFLAGNRIPLTMMIALGLVAGSWLARHGQRDRGLLIAVACGGQLLMIGLDPNPFEYVYGWAAIPAVLGIVCLSRTFAAYFPFLIAAAAVALSVGYTVLKGHAPPTSSYIRLTFDPLLTDAELDRLDTPALVGMLVSDKRQQSLENQLRVRSQLCRRVRGTVLATFDTHPVCLDDATYYWSGRVLWPPLLEEDTEARGPTSKPEFEKMFVDARPRVFIWAHRWEPSRPLLPQTRQMLACCYDLYDGFAVSREPSTGK